MVIREDSISLFSQDKKYVLDYYKLRNFTNPVLESIILQYQFGLLEEIPFFVNGMEYDLSHFLTKSVVPGYDIIKANSLLGTDSTDEIAIALVLGDDAISCNVNTQAVYLWLIQTGNGEKILLSDSLADFLESIHL